MKSSRLVYLHLLALAALAFARPLLELLAASPEFFPARGGDRGDVVLTVVLVLLVAPLPLLLLVAAARRWWPGRVADTLAAAAVGLLVGLVVMRGLALTETPPWLCLLLVTAVAGGSAWAYLRTPVARSLATWLSPVFVLVPALFLLNPGIARLLEPAPRSIPRHPSGAKTPVVVVVLDELPLASLLDGAGSIDAQRVPHIAAFARQATWFRNAAAPSGNTHSAVPAILSGRVEPPGDPRQRERNLCTLLGDYPIYAIEAWSTTCPREHNLLKAQRRPERFDRALRLGADLPVLWLELVAPAAWRRHLPELTGGWDRFAAGAGDAAPPKRRGKIGHLGRRPGRDAFLASIAAHDRVLYFGHMVYPHAPWEHLPSGRIYACKPECYPPARVEAGPWRAAQLFQRYLLQLSYADATVGEVVARLRKAGLYERSLVVVVADHGAAFDAGFRFRGTEEATLGETLGVPLLVKRPGQSTGAVDATPVTTADLLATVAAELDVHPPWPVPGRSLFAGGRGARSYVTFGDKQMRTVPSDLEARVFAARDHFAALVRGSDGDPERIGPLPDLLGSRVEGLAEAPALALTIDAPERFADVDPSVEPLPLLLSGTLSGAAPGDGCCTLAVAVDDTVVATTHSFWTADGRHRMVAMLPERTLHRGRLKVAVAVVGDDGRTQRRLRTE